MEIVKSRDPERIDISDKLEQILSTTLTPENIDFYADRALDDLVALSADAVSDFSKRMPEIAVEQIEEGDKEDAAFEYFGLPSINLSLEHISGLAAEIRGLDRTIEALSRRGEVIIPPDKNIDLQITTSDGSYEEKKVMPRLKTILLLLKKTYEVSVDDPEHLTLQKGILDPRMMRGESYVALIAPKLAHTIFVCDEEGNATYVIHNPTLEMLNLSPEDLMGMSKSEINDLLAKNSSLGKRIVYSSRFVNNIQRALSVEEDHQNDLDPRIQRVEYLRPSAELAPEGYLSESGIARGLGISGRTVRKAIDALNEVIGERFAYKFGPNITFGYSPEQIEKIRGKIDSTDGFAPLAPDGYLSAHGIIENTKLGQNLLSKVIKLLDGELGERKKYKFGSKITEGYSPEQIKLILNYLDAQGHSSLPPEGFLTISGIANLLGLEDPAVKKAIENLGVNLGDTKIYKFKTNLTTGYSPDQQIKIIEYLKDSGAFISLPPEGYKSIRGMAEQFGVSKRRLAKATQTLSGELGRVESYKFFSHTTGGYSPEQQGIIKQYLDSTQKPIYNPPPKEYLSAHGIAKLIGIPSSTVKKAIKDLDGKLGEIKEYKFGPRSAFGFSPVQIERIVEYMDSGRQGVS